MPSPLLVAEVESARGELVWPTLSYLEWEALPWRPVENVTDDEALARAQYQRLRDWADTHAQPIRSVQVMADAASLVEVEHTLRQLVNVKGT